MGSKIQFVEAYIAYDDSDLCEQLATVFLTKKEIIDHCEIETDDSWTLVRLALPQNPIMAQRLEWTTWEGHFGNSWLSQITGFNSNYTIWIDRSSGKTKVSGLDLKKTEHDSVQAAKDWCQNDFEEKVKFLLTKEVSNG